MKLKHAAIISTALVLLIGVSIVSPFFLFIFFLSPRLPFQIDFETIKGTTKIPMSLDIQQILPCIGFNSDKSKDFPGRCQEKNRSRAIDGLIIYDFYCGFEYINIVKYHKFVHYPQ